MIKAKKRTWREKKERIWGSLYSGLHIQVEGHNILISKLWHGLKVIEITNPDCYNFTEDVEEYTEVSTNFVQEALIALSADTRFQKQLDEFDRVTS